MTQTLGAPRPAVSVDELKRAWNAVQAGRFRTGTGATRDLHQPPSPPAGNPWEPGPGERVLPVIGCAGSCGATTISLALAGAAALPARVVECSSVTASGLAAASTAELGLQGSGWTRGTRDGVLLERAGNVLVSIQEVPTPSVPERDIGLTVLDIGWEIGQVAATPAWLGEQVRGADLAVLVTTATVPGLRRLESALDLLAGTSTCAAVIGPRPKKWPRPVACSAGPRTRVLEAAGRLIDVPEDRALAITGLDTTPLPASLLQAAATLLLLLPPVGTTMKGDTP
ncbi:MAG TPA: hypothetical protein VIJ07_04760 [Dermatophilaceae bacterium]